MSNLLLGFDLIRMHLLVSVHKIYLKSLVHNSPKACSRWSFVGILFAAAILDLRWQMTLAQYHFTNLTRLVPCWPSDKPASMYLPTYMQYQPLFIQQIVGSTLDQL